MTILKHISFVAILCFSGSLQGMLGSGSAAKNDKSSRPLMRLVDRELLLDAARSYNEGISYVLHKGALVNTQDEVGDTALHKAVKNQNPNALDKTLRVVTTLIHAGADCTLKNDAGFSPLDLLREAKEKQEEVSLLIAACMINAVDGKYRNQRSGALDQALGKMLDGVVFFKSPQSLGLIGGVVDAILSTGFDMTTRSKDYTCTMYSRYVSYPSESSANHRTPPLLPDHPINVHRKNIKEAARTAVFAFQEKHSAEIQAAIGAIIPKELFPLVFECLYIRPQKGVMPGHLKNLLIARPLTAEHREKIMDYIRLGGDVNGRMFQAQKETAQNNATAAALVPIHNNDHKSCVEHGATKPDHVPTPLSLAIESGDVVLVNSLFKQGAGFAKGHRNCALVYLVAQQKGKQAIMDLFKFGMVRSAYEILLNENIDRFETLLANGLDVNIVEENRLGKSNLLTALVGKQIYYPEKFLKLVQLLVSRAIDLNFERSSWVIYSGKWRYATALERAVNKQRREVVKLLLYVNGSNYDADPRVANLWQHCKDDYLKQLLKKPSNIADYLTEQEQKEFAAIKAEREKWLAKNNKAESEKTAAH